MTEGLTGGAPDGQARGAMVGDRYHLWCSTWNLSPTFATYVVDPCYSIGRARAPQRMSDPDAPVVVLPADDPACVSPALAIYAKTRRCLNCWTWYSVGPEGACHVVMADAVRIGPLCPPCGASVLRPRDDR